jgi:hypothetical protein
MMGSRLMVRVRWLVVALVLAPAGVRADDTELARAHFARGKQHYDAGKYQDAIRSFRAAAAIQGSPLLDYNIGRCQEKLGQIDEAIASYERYLAGKPDAANQAEVRAKLAELRKRKAAGVPKDPYEELEKRPPASAPATPAAGTAEEPGAARQTTPRSVTPRAARAASPEDPPHEASLPQSYAPVARPVAPARVAGAMPAPAAPPPRPVTPPRRDEGPFYKQWWFWVAVAGGVVIAGFVIGVAASGSGDVPSKTSGLEVRF